MFDENLLFSDGQALTADAYSTSALHIYKTPQDGVDIEVVVTASTTLATLDVVVLEKSADSGWGYNTAPQPIAHGRVTVDSGGLGRIVIHAQSKLAYLKLYYDGDSWGTATVTAGIVSGGPRDHGA